MAILYGCLNTQPIQIFQNPVHQFPAFLIQPYPFNFKHFINQRVIKCIRGQEKLMGQLY